MQLIITMQTIELGLGYRVLYNNVAKMYSNSNNEKYQILQVTGWMWVVSSILHFLFLIEVGWIVITAWFTASRYRLQTHPRSPFELDRKYRNNKYLFWQLYCCNCHKEPAAGRSWATAARAGNQPSRRLKFFNPITLLHWEWCQL